MIYFIINRAWHYSKIDNCYTAYMSRQVEVADTLDQ